MKIAGENPDIVIASLMKHLRIPQDVARGAHRSFANVWEEVPYVRTDSVQAILDFLPKEQVKGVTPEKYIDNSLIKELETSGFIKRFTGSSNAPQYGSKSRSAGITSLPKRRIERIRSSSAISPKLNSPITVLNTPSLAALLICSMTVAGEPTKARLRASNIRDRWRAAQSRRRRDRRV